MEWRSIESAPKDGSVVDLHGKRKGSMLGMTIRIENCKWGLVKEESGLMVKKDWIDTNGKVVVPTHWMPLPKPLKDEVK